MEPSSQISPKVTGATAGAAAGILLLFIIDQTGVAAVDGATGDLARLVVSMVLAFVGGWTPRDPLRNG